MKKRQLTSVPLTDQFTLNGSEGVGGLNLTVSEIEVKAAGSIVLPKHMFDPAARPRPNITLKR